MANQQSAYNGATMVVASTATSNVASTAIGTQTYQVRLSASNNCHYTFDTTTATTSHALLPQLVTEYVSVRPGQKIAVIRASTAEGISQADGSVYLTELS